MHPRIIIRNAIKNLLLGNPQSDPPVYPLDAGRDAQFAIKDNIFTNRPTPLMETEVPALCIWFHSEESNNDRDASRRKYDRIDHMFVEAIVVATEDCDDILDAIAEKVESLLLAGGKDLIDPVSKVLVADDFYLENSRLELIGEEATGIVASLLMGFFVEYSSEISYDAGSKLNTVNVEATDETLGSGAGIESDNTGLNP